MIDFQLFSIESEFLFNSKNASHFYEMTHFENAPLIMNFLPQFPWQIQLMDQEQGWKNEMQRFVSF